MNKIKYTETREFSKDVKKLSKRYRTLNEDLKILKRASIELYHLHDVDNNSIFPIPNFCNDFIRSYKVKKIASMSFKGKGVKSGLRLIYIFDSRSNQVFFVELYFKGDKENEDKERLRRYFDSLI